MSIENKFYLKDEDNIFYRRLLEELNKENPNVELLKFLDKKVDEEATQLITETKVFLHINNNNNK